MQEVKKINSNSSGKIFSIIYGLVGFLTSFITTILTMINIIMESGDTGPGAGSIIFNIFAILFFAIFVGVVTAAIGWLFGFLTAAAYNLFAAKYGGVIIELAEIKSGAAATAKNDINK